MLYTLTYVPTALLVANNFSQDLKTPLVNTIGTNVADFQQIDHTNGNTFVKSAKCMLWFKNEHATDAVDITIVSARDDTPNFELNLPNGDEALVGPFPNTFGANGSTVTVNYATATSSVGIEVAVIDLP